METNNCRRIMSADLREGQIVVEHERRKVALEVVALPSGALAVSFAAIGPWAGDRLTRAYLMPDSPVDVEQPTVDELGAALILMLEPDSATEELLQRSLGLLSRVGR